MKSHPGARHVLVKLAHPAHEPRDLDVGQNGPTVDYDQMQTDAKIRQPAGACYRIGSRLSPNHQARG
jgi:hypothetical protein